MLKTKILPIIIGTIICEWIHNIRSCSLWYQKHKMYGDK